MEDNFFEFSSISQLLIWASTTGESRYMSSSLWRADLELDVLLLQVLFSKSTFYLGPLHGGSRYMSSSLWRAALELLSYFFKFSASKFFI